MYLFLDDSEFYSNRESDIPDVFLMGGIFIDHRNSILLGEKIRETVANYASEICPIKWNFKDLRNFYEASEDIGIHYRELHDSSTEWRIEIARKAKEIDFQIILAAIQSHSTRKKVIKTKKTTLNQFVFSNILMRLGFEVKCNQSTTSSQIVLDWPDKSARKPFNLEYFHAYEFGKTYAGQTYKCGPLKYLGFPYSLCFSTSNYCPQLQFADLITGAGKEFIKRTLKSTPYGTELKFLEILKSKIRGYPSNILGRGIIVPRDNQHFRNSVEEAISNHLAIGVPF